MEKVSKLLVTAPPLVMLRPLLLLLVFCKRCLNGVFEERDISEIDFIHFLPSLATAAEQEQPPRRKPEVRIP